METKTQKALNIIEKRPGIRSAELSQAAGIEHKQLSGTMNAAVASGFVVTSTVKRPGQQDTIEWRLSSAVVAADWPKWVSEHRSESRRNPLQKKEPGRRQIQRQAPETIERRAVEIAVDRHNAAVELREQLRNAEMQRDEHFATAEDYKNQLALAESALQCWQDVAQAYGCEGYHQLRNRLESLHKTSAETDEPPVDIKDVAIGYVIRVPKRKPRLCAKPERAVEAAKSAAKAAGRADVLALIPVGTARCKKTTTIEFKEAI